MAKGMVAVVLVGLQEYWRQGLVWLLLALLLAVGLSLPALQAVDVADHQRLAVVSALAGMAGFGQLLALLLPAAQLRRDLDSRIGLMLFSKPLSRMAYVLGRWGGAQLVVAAMLLSLCLTTILSMRLGIGPLPEPRQVMAPHQVAVVDAFGEVSTVHRQVVTLAGRAGNAVRLDFSKVHGGSLLLRARVQEADPSWSIARARVAISAWPAGKPQQRQPLSVAPTSPYGALADAAAGQVLLHDRASSRSDLGRDYLRLQLPDGLHAAVTVQILRLEDQSNLRLRLSDGVYVAQSGGHLGGNLVFAGLAIWAQTGLFAAVGICLATISHIGTCALGGLVLFFAGHSHALIDGVLQKGSYGQLSGRLLVLVRDLLPDLERFSIDAQLAGGRAVPWSSVLGSWAWYGGYALIFIVLAWWSLRRREAL